MATRRRNDSDRRYLNRLRRKRWPRLPRTTYYDQQLRPIDMWRWSELLQHNVVKRTALRHVVVSTVHLGINHQWHPDGPPLVFETMAFYSNGDGEHEGVALRTPGGGEWQFRWTTKREALIGHRLIASMASTAHAAQVVRDAQAEVDAEAAGG